MNSKLQIIGKSAFARSSIESIFIPRHVKKISRYTFDGCDRLKMVEIPNDSELQVFEEYSFYNTSIKYLYVPSKVVELKDDWCYGTNELTMVTFDANNKKFQNYENKLIFGKSDINSDIFDVIVFAQRKIKSITIPLTMSRKIKSITSHITKICKNAFECCDNLNKIDTPFNSELIIIENDAFAFSSIVSIFIPKNISTIYNNLFKDCDQLQIIEIDENSRISSIKISYWNQLRNILIMIPKTADICFI